MAFLCISYSRQVALRQDGVSRILAGQHLSLALAGRKGWQSCASVCVVWSPLSLLLINLAKLNSPIEAGRLVARERIFRIVAGERALVKDGGVSADEAPLSCLDDGPGLILDGQADVKDLAVVGHIGIVAVGLTLAREPERDGSREDEVGVGRELVSSSRGG